MIRKSHSNWVKLYNREINSSFAGFEPFQFNVRRYDHPPRLTLKINLIERGGEERRKSEKNFETWSSRLLARSSDACCLKAAAVFCILLERSKHRRLPHWADFLKYNFSGMCKNVPCHRDQLCQRVTRYIILNYSPKLNITQFLLIYSSKNTKQKFLCCNLNKSIDIVFFRGKYYLII